MIIPPTPYYVTSDDMFNYISEKYNFTSMHSIKYASMSRKYNALSNVTKKIKEIAEHNKNNWQPIDDVMLPKQLWDFCAAMQSKVASSMLYKKLYELAKDANKNTLFVTKIGYYVEKETRIPYLVVSDLNGKESFSSMSSDIETFANNAKDNLYKVYLFKLDNELTPNEFELLSKYND